MTGQLEALARTMRRHDHEAPDADVVVRGLAARLPDAGRRSAPRAGTAAAVLVAAAAVVVGGTTLVGSDNGPVDVALDPSATGTATPGTVSSPDPTAAPSSFSTPRPLLDPLTSSFTLGTPRDGMLASRLTVVNETGLRLIDPGCLVLANYSFGVTTPDRPDVDLSGRVMTRCTGPGRIPPGYRASSPGPDVDVSGLAPGRYVLVVDFGEARSERLAADFEIP